MANSNKGKDSVLLYAVGDVCVNRNAPDSIFSLSAPIIREADIAFCQLETNYSERGAPQFVSRVPLRAHPRNAPAIRNAGFNVVSAAGNHCGDWGHDALLDTIEVMTKTGVQMVGVGRNIAEARKPVILEKKGTKVAFLSYCSILPYRYWAEANRPGCAPVRGVTVYTQREVDQPGTPADIHSYANREDLSAMVEDVKKIRPLVDVVVVSHHFGLHFITAELADYQIEIAHAAIDAGVDLILGHHAHILKAIEVYKGKVITYSLGNFAFDLPLPDEVLHDHQLKTVMKLKAWVVDPEYRSYPFPVESRMTMILKCRITGKKIERVSFLPVYINKNAQPEILTQKEERFHEIVKYMEDITKQVGIDTKYVIEENEVVVGI